MKYVFIGKETVKSMNDIHTMMAKTFKFPKYYGKNLDALYDCLSEIASPVLIIVGDFDYLRDILKDKYEPFIQVLRDSARNGNIILREI